MDGDTSTTTGNIKSWRSILTLILFVGTNIIVLSPFHVPIFIPRPLSNAVLDTLSAWRVLSPRQHRSRHEGKDGQHAKAGFWVRVNLPLNFVTAPFIADLFLLAIGAIGRTEIYGGTIGADHIHPIDIMIFFLSLAYIAISIDASGLIRWLAFKVLQKGGGHGHRLFFYLYAFFFGLGSFIGNDPIILSGTAFLAYMTRVSNNSIVHPRAWIHSQFAVANIASAILVSSNPTNLVLAGAFNIKFITYTANMIVPVVVTAIVLFPFLLYIVFADDTLIPRKIKMEELSAEARAKDPVNPNIPNARGVAEEQEKEMANDEVGNLLSLEEILHPFLDKKGAAFGALIMATTLITLLSLNAADQKTGAKPVFWVTLPAAFVMFCWDVGTGWIQRHKTREIAANGRRELEQARRTKEEEEARGPAQEQEKQDDVTVCEPNSSPRTHSPEARPKGQSDLAGGNSCKSADDEIGPAVSNSTTSRPVAATLHAYENGDGLTLVSTPRIESSSSADDKLQNGQLPTSAMSILDEKQGPVQEKPSHSEQGLFANLPKSEIDEMPKSEIKGEKQERPTLVSRAGAAFIWAQETFPTVMAVLIHLPVALVPFAFCMFILVQALITKGWVPVFAHGWDHWVTKTGTLGAIGGMGFLSVILCNFAGTNIGTTILLSRVIQAWQGIHQDNQVPISNRLFWATVYSMALGVNFGAFSTAFSASLAGLLWRDILARKHIRVRSLDFARVNLPIISIAMATGCAVLVGEVYIIRDDRPYN